MSSLVGRCLVALALVGFGCQGSSSDRTGGRSDELSAAQCLYFAVAGKTRICHATGSARNPFVVLNISDQACISAHTAHPRDYVAVGDPTCQGLGCLPAAAPCDATLGCCAGLTCQDGTCVAPATCANVTCPTDDPCRYWSCDPATGSCVAEPKIPGFECDDGNACTTADVCNGAGACVGGAPRSCDDGNTCTTDACNAATGCTHASNTAACDDGDGCTQTDACTAGVCVGSNPVMCTAADQCHVAGACDPSSGTCSNPAAADGTACTDGDGCTQTDACAAGACVGANPVTCTASDQCHLAGVCDPSSGACTNPIAADGTACTDGDACTQTDACTAGACVGSNAVTCTAADQCHLAGVCDPSSGTCSNPIAPEETVTCGIGACTRTTTTCIAGQPHACVPGEPSAEECNGIDDDCDSATDEELGEVTCGTGACTQTVAACLDGTPAVCLPGEPSAETCNGVDDDCDGVIDEPTSAAMASFESLPEVAGGLGTVADLDGDGRADLVTIRGASLDVALGDGTGSFTWRTTIDDANPATGEGSIHEPVQTADFDGDGAADLLVASWLGMEVYLNDGTGLFGSATFVLPAPVPASLGDVTGDGHVDMVADGAVWAGDGTGAFSYLGGAPGSGALADMDADGDLDLVSGAVDINLNDGAGSFTYASYAQCHGGDDVAVADLDGDGDLDVATVGSGSIVCTALGDGNGGIGSPAEFSVTNNTASSEGPMSVAIGDVNGDGTPDVVATLDNRVQIFVALGDGSGHFGPGWINPAGGFFAPSFGTVEVVYARSWPSSVMLVDLDEDDRLDLVADDDLDVTSLFRNTTAAIPAVELAVPTVARGGALALGDFDGDGRPDLVATDGGLLSVFLGTGGGFVWRDDLDSVSASTALPSPLGHAADFDEDGAPDLLVPAEEGTAVFLNDGTGDFGGPTFLGSGAEAPAIGDVDGDGHLDILLASIWRGDGHGGFTQLGSLPGGVGSKALGDLDGDLDLDLVGDGAVFLNDGSGVFAPASAYTGCGSVVLTDLDDDGDLDAASADGNGSICSALGDGSGGFATPVSFNVTNGVVSQSEPSAGAVGDLNGDGSPDIAIPIPDSVDIYVALGDGSGSFGPGHPRDSGRGFEPPGFGPVAIAYAVTWPTAVLLADVDSDGRTDIVAREGDSSSVFLNDSHRVASDPGVDLSTLSRTMEWPRGERSLHDAGAGLDDGVRGRYRRRAGASGCCVDRQLSSVECSRCGRSPHESRMDGWSSTSRPTSSRRRGRGGRLGDDLDAKERAELHASLDRALADSEAGRGVDAVTACA